ncbi:MAG: FkbM family methyltransferase [Candidatus Micrarchaeota archaeon]|nr:FkbM family methyltransferase [Candidatus Micrarchaeota archaeon]
MKPVALFVKSNEHLHGAYLRYFKSRNLARLSKLGIRYDPKTKTAILDYKKQNISFACSGPDSLLDMAGLLADQFVDEQYAWLSPKGSNVVDIGANIADSAIYFAANGAMHVYAIEPFPHSHRIASRNISLNKYGKRITLLRVACGGRPGSIRIDPKIESNAASVASHSGKGVGVPIVTLKQLSDRYNLGNAVLKIDCEGCEYGIIMSSDRQTLRRFSRIMIEAHYGYKEMGRKLRSCGFSVRLTPLNYMLGYDKRDMLLGMVYAERK